MLILTILCQYLIKKKKVDRNHKDREGLRNTFYQRDLIDVYGTRHLWAEHTIFSSVCELIKIHHLLGCETILGKFTRTQIIEYDGIKIEINIKKISRKWKSHVWMLNTLFIYLF